MSLGQEGKLAPAVIDWHPTEREQATLPDPETFHLDQFHQSPSFSVSVSCLHKDYHLSKSARACLSILQRTRFRFLDQTQCWNALL